MTEKILIVGAGIVGINTAYMIHKKCGSAVEITIVDSHDGIAKGASFRNGGQVSVCNAPAWNTWGNVFKGIKWALSETGPLKISGAWTAHKIGWLRDFVQEIPNNHENTMEMIDIARGSRAIYNQLFSENLISLESLRKTGILKVYRSERSFNNGVSEAVYMAVSQESPKVINLSRDNATFNEFLANLRIGEIHNSICGAVHYPYDFTFDSSEYCVKMGSYLMANGVKFKFNTTTINSMDELFDKVIYCTGSAMRDSGYINSVDINIYPVKGYSVTYNIGEKLNLNTSILDEDLKIVATPLANGTLRIAGTAELNGYDQSYGCDHPRIVLLHEWAVSNGFVDKTTPFVPYSCLRPMTPNMLPFVRRDGKKIYHGGHGHLGQTTSMQTAEWVASMI